MALFRQKVPDILGDKGIFNSRSTYPRMYHKKVSFAVMRELTYPFMERIDTPRSNKAFPVCNS